MRGATHCPNSADGAGTTRDPTRHFSEGGRGDETTDKNFNVVNKCRKQRRKKSRDMRLGDPSATLGACVQQALGLIAGGASAEALLRKLVASLRRHKDMQR